MYTANNTALHHTLGVLRRCLVQLQARHGDHAVIQRLAHGVGRLEIDAADLPIPRRESDDELFSVAGADHDSTPWQHVAHRSRGGDGETADPTLLDEHLDEAFEYLELAIRDHPGEAPVELAMMLVRLILRLRPESALQHVPMLGGAMREGKLLGRGLLWFVRFLIVHDRVDDVAEGLARLVERMDELDEHSRSEVVKTRMWAAYSHPELVSGLPPTPVGANPQLVDLDVHVRAAAALTDPKGGRLDDAVTAAEQVLRDADLTTELSEAVREALHTLLYLEKLDRVKSWCDTLMTGRHKAADLAGTRRELAMIRAEVALRTGDLASAREYARFALDTADPRREGADIGMVLGTLLQATTAMGKFDEAAETMARGVPQHLDHVRYGLHHLFAKGRYRLATQQLPAALNDFLSCGELMVEWKLDAPGILPWRTGAAEVYLLLGNAAMARKLIDQQLALPVIGPSLSRGTALRIKAATVRLRQRAPLLHQALEEVQAAGGQLEVARVLADLSRTYHELGERDRARVTVRRAWRIARDCQAEPLCSQLIPDQSGAQEEVRVETGVSALSVAERRVAGLAVLGYTNREIANKLYVTTSTVEQHLTKAYRKLNVRQRKNLPAALSSEVTSSV
ncbi:MAG TPA: LuxR C-terminal-related transcriptional regulator [Umezawaea sp.]|nr:LuxR C-terminal-related transcriptional regulator [Umezawaea sp.]